MVNSGKIRFDGEKLRLELVRRDVTMKRASLELGFNASYIEKLCHVGEMRQSVASGLENLYLIKPESYIIKDEEPKNEMPTNYNELYKVIYAAVYEAIKKALE